MPRAPKSTEALHALLAQANVSLSLGQVQRALEADIGPMEGCDPVGHWRIYASLAAGPSLRLPDHDEAALSLAEQGLACSRLGPAILRLAGVAKLVSSGSYERPADLIERGEQRVEGVFIEARASGADPALAWLAQGSVRRADDLQRGNKDPDDDPALGRLRAALGEATEAAHGARIADPEDVAAILGVETSSVAGIAADLTATNGPTPPALAGAKVLMSTRPEAVAGLVRLVAGAFPDVEARGLPIPPGQRRSRVLAYSVLIALPLFAPLLELAPEAITGAIGLMAQGARLPTARVRAEP